ncbi:fatty acyl-CoA hydrolase precursor, medium chain-like [Brevipalpus obovatus]|uniref:fatty acyl-CoA hydrolase precursor, medium chain-like n=1 Tax=Brevipalpus obovatus TaxID=246614 RepID=UPI003D9EAB3B
MFSIMLIMLGNKIDLKAYSNVHSFGRAKFNLIHDGKFSKCSSHEVHLFRSCIYLLLKPLLLLIMCSICAIKCDQASERINSPIVSTKYGLIRGRLITLSTFQPINVFLGIPYAHPPTGEFRFMPPGTPALWNGVRNALHHGPVCPQVLPDIRNETQVLQRITKNRLDLIKRLIPSLQNQSEDCLYMNIYAPSFGNGENKRPNLLPVMMLIHGESYEWNSGSSYDGSLLASVGNVIVVTINYRLGVLGFFPAFDRSARGNFGLMDQIAALHWIQQNIAEFGGNPSDVTIFGQDYGAMLINLLMISPAAKGHFHRALMQSGSALSPLAMMDNVTKYGRSYASAIGCYKEGFKNSQIIECLRQKNISELLSIQLASPRFLTGFGPIVEGIVIPSDPLILMNDPSSHFSTYDLLIGTNDLESLIFFSQNDLNIGIEPARRDKIARTLVRNTHSHNLQEIYLTICNEYTDWTMSPQANSNVIQSVYQLVNDALFTGPIIKTALAHSKYNNKPTRMYSLVNPNAFHSYTTNTTTTTTAATSMDATSLGIMIHSISSTLPPPSSPPAHSISLDEDALFFSFGLIPYSSDNHHLHPLSHLDAARDSPHFNITLMLIQYWANFAHHGDPNRDYRTQFQQSPGGMGSTSKPSPQLSGANSVHWPNYDAAKQQYILFNSSQVQIKSHYNAHRLSIWLNLIPRLHSSGASVTSSAGADVYHSQLQQHLLEEFDNLDLYEGIVRPMPLMDRPGNSGTPFDLWPNHTSNDQTRHSLYLHSPDPRLHPHDQGHANSIPGKVPTNSSHTSNGRSKNNSTSGNESPNSSYSMIIQHENPYSTALSVTIAVGCALLLLNLLVFAGVYLHRDKRITDRRQIASSNLITSSYQARGSTCRILDPNEYNQCNRVRLKDSISNDMSNCVHQCTFNNSPSNEFTGIEIQHPCSATCSTNDPVGNNAQTSAMMCPCEVTECPYYVCDCLPEHGNTNNVIGQDSNCVTTSNMISAKNHDHSNEMIIKEQSNGPINMVSA